MNGMKIKTNQRKHGIDFEEFLINTVIGIFFVYLSVTMYAHVFWCGHCSYTSGSFFTALFFGFTIMVNLFQIIGHVTFWVDTGKQKVCQARRLRLKERQIKRHAKSARRGCSMPVQRTSSLKCAKSVAKSPSYFPFCAITPTKAWGIYISSK